MENPFKKQKQENVVVEQPTVAINPAELEQPQQTTEITEKRNDTGPEELPTGEEPKVETYEHENKELPEEVTQPQIVQVPVFMTQADKDKLLYDTHLMVKEIYTSLKK